MERVGELVPGSRATSLPCSASSAPLLCVTTSSASSSTQPPPEHSMTTYQRPKIGNRMDPPLDPPMRVGCQRAAPHPLLAPPHGVSFWAHTRGWKAARRCRGPHCFRTAATGRAELMPHQRCSYSIGWRTRRGDPIGLQGPGGWRATLFAGPVASRPAGRPTRARRPGTQAWPRSSPWQGRAASRRTRCPGRAPTRSPACPSRHGGGAWS